MTRSDDPAEAALAALEDAASTLATLREAASKACVVCGGKGTRRTVCSMCHDSTWDHECDDEEVDCSACAPLRAALAAVPTDFLAKRDARVRAEALREAADAAVAILGARPRGVDDALMIRVGWLRDRADEIERGAR